MVWRLTYVQQMPTIKITVKGRTRDKYTIAQFKDSNGYISEVLF